MIRAALVAFASLVFVAGAAARGPASPADHGLIASRCAAALTSRSSDAEFQKQYSMASDQAAIWQALTTNEPGGLATVLSELNAFIQDDAAARAEALRCLTVNAETLYPPMPRSPPGDPFACTSVLQEVRIVLAEAVVTSGSPTAPDRPKLCEAYAKAQTILTDARKELETGTLSCVYPEGAWITISTQLFRMSALPAAAPMDCDARPGS